MDNQENVKVESEQEVNGHDARHADVEVNPEVAPEFDPEETAPEASTEEVKPEGEEVAV